MRKRTRYNTHLLCGVAAISLLASAGAAHADEKRDFNIAAQPLATALMEFGAQSGVAVVVPGELTTSRVSRGVSAQLEPEAALKAMLAGTGLSYRREGELFAIVQEGGSGPQGASAGDVDALIVTAQKREENIQDVPIAISAFSAEALEAQKIEGGFDLLKAIPNVTFSKNNFTSYNFSIRGIGTKAVSATTDPGVSVSFNNTGLIQNRLFEQEYFDVERVEVLRGPQGTLYGRNATAGVINVISAKPDLNDFEGSFKVEVGNYNAKRGQFMLNVPVLEDKLAVRLAGALTKRDGYDFNAITDHPVNGRDLWSARLTVGFEPTDRVRANLIWEHFEEDDDRSRTGKQLCHRDNGPPDIGGDAYYNPDGFADEYERVLRPALFSQGCQPGNLYDDAAFGTPNGLALPFVLGMMALSTDCGVGCSQLYQLGVDPVTDRPVGLLQLKDPYAGATQSRDLRTIASFRDPVYRAKADVFQLNAEFDVTDSITFVSQTAYNEDEVYSFQDFNRFNTAEIFNDTSQLLYRAIASGSPPEPSPWRPIAPNGEFCDPQLGCSKTMAGFDISQATAKQFSQEFRLQSDFDGALNFSVGANYTKFDVLVDYYVFYNLITAYAMQAPFNGRPDDAPFGSAVDLSICGLGGGFLGGPAVPIKDPKSLCPYIDPNPIESIDGDGHNYFRSKNPYHLKSAAAFGEIYWQIDDQLKLTAGLRYTDDRKIFTPVPSQVLLAPGLIAGGTISHGYPEDEPIKQHWGEWTGRIGLDWKPEVSFTDDTMLYAFYSRGYKGGGANPPSPGFASEDDIRIRQAELFNVPEFLINLYYGLGFLPTLELTGVEYERTFKPEFVNAFEIGAKNTLLDGAMTFNAGAFFYDYKDYQVSQIRDRTAVNENFDAKVWGVEFETVFSPSRDLQFIANLGYLDTEIADGETSIDIMDRTAGNEGWLVMKPWVQLPSNCVIPVSVAQNWAVADWGLRGYYNMCGGLGGLIAAFDNVPPIDDATGLPYDPLYYDGTNGRPDINGGSGFAKDLGGNELPNSPHWTVNLGAQYGMDWIDGWRATVRGDAYWQSQSWARVYNSDPYDKLHGWYNVNLSLWLEHEDSGVKVELYAKNLLDKTPITDAFLNSDDTALTTNVFVLDPRLIGLSIRKEF